MQQIKRNINKDILISGVIHAGLYCVPDSLKAEFTVEGHWLLRMKKGFTGGPKSGCLPLGVKGKDFPDSQFLSGLDG